MRTFLVIALALPVSALGFVTANSSAASPILLGIFYAGGPTYKLLFENRRGEWCVPKANVDYDKLEKSSPITTSITFDKRTIGSGTVTFEGSKPKLSKISKLKQIEALSKKVRSLPFVTTSTSSFSDPAHWKIIKTPSSDETAVFQKWLRVGLFRCLPDEEKKANGERVSISKVYRNKNGDLLVRFYGETDVAFCSDDKTAADFAGTMWVFLAKNGVGTAMAWGEELVDAGDYDGDGRSELLFYEKDKSDQNVSHPDYFTLVFGEDYSKHIRVFVTGKTVRFGGKRGKAGELSGDCKSN